jgi:hypothetical protein
VLLFIDEAMSTRTRQIYEPLPHTSEYLRILTLHAGGVSDPIRCSLRTASFREKPSYDALSYTWGDPNDTKPIEVDGVEIQVTSNLERALRHLREGKEDLAMWVDAVCINQSDKTEKSHQVAAMGKIYSECAQVRIWLGCDASHCGLERCTSPTNDSAENGSERVDPFELIGLLAEDRHIHEWPCFQTPAEDGRGGIVYKADNHFDKIYDGFLAVCGSSWWTRIWTVQEAVLPKKGMLTYDTWNTSLQTITDYGARCSGHSGCCHDALSKLFLKVEPTLSEFCNTAMCLWDDRRRHDSISSKNRRLLYQHATYGFRICEDPRDKVFGLLGIVDNPIFTPDYTLSVDEVYFQTTVRILSQGESSLNSLIGRRYGPAPRKWAAWVPDFNAPFDRRECIHDMIWFQQANSHIYNASNSNKSASVVLMAQAHREDDTTSQVGLETVGRRVGIVTFVSQDQCLRGIRRKDVLRQWVLEALDWDVLHEPAYGNTPINTSEYPDIVIRLWRTLLRGQGVTPQWHPWSKSEETAISSLSEFLAWLREDNGMLSLRVIRPLLVSTAGRCYFKAGKDSHGLCYPRTCVGDEVWVLNGGSVPFILRPTDLDQDIKEALRPLDEKAFISHGRYEFREDRQSDKVPEGYYQFIGDCYFDGFMNGEVVRDSSFREQTIVLL